MARQFGGTSPNIILPAPIIVFSLIITPGKIIQLEPIQQLALILTAKSKSVPTYIFLVAGGQNGEMENL
jgi:hypothetical protein